MIKKLLDTETIKKRLSLIKFIYGTGLNQADQPLPMASVCILSFHDSVELFLHLISEHYDCGRSGIGFMDYWDVIGRVIDGELSHKESMRRLNNSRVSLKHHGLLPSYSTIEELKGAITSFFIDNTLQIFDLSFDSISMIDLVQCEGCRSALTTAEENWEKENKDECLKNVTRAFYILIEDYEDRKRSEYGSSPFFFGRDMTFQTSFFMEIENSALGRFIDNVKESISAIRDAVKILSFGFDYRKYTKFRLLTPLLRGSLGGTEYFGDLSEREFSHDDFIFCKEFIIESAIKLQEFDYEVSRKMTSAADIFK